MQQQRCTTRVAKQNKTHTYCVRADWYSPSRRLLFRRLRRRHRRRPLPDRHRLVRPRPRAPPRPAAAAVSACAAVAAHQLQGEFQYNFVQFRHIYDYAKHRKWHHELYRRWLQPEHLVATRLLVCANDHDGKFVRV